MTDVSTRERAALLHATRRWQRLLMPLVSLGLFVAALWGIHHLLAETALQTSQRNFDAYRFSKSS